MNKEEFIERINNKAWSSPVPDFIINDCYNFFFSGESQWKLYLGEPLYVIGLSEDKFDYYWVCINNKERKLKFITCVYDISKPCDYVTKKFNKEESKNIFSTVKEYFRTHSHDENLIYIDNKLFGVEND